MLDTLTRAHAGLGSGRGDVRGSSNTGCNRPEDDVSSRSSNSTVGEDGTIRIDHMHAGLRIPFRQQGAVSASITSVSKDATKVEYVNSGIDQNVDIKEGQKVVVGRSSLEGPEHGAVSGNAGRGWFKWQAVGTSARRGRKGPPLYLLGSL